MPFRKRQRQDSDSDEDDSPNYDAPSVSATIETNKNMIKMRKKTKGINVSSLALGVKVSRLEEYTMEKDPFKYKPSLKSRHVKDRDRDRKYDLVDRDVTDLGNTFSQQTNSKDTDAQMKRYIEEQMRKAKGEFDSGAADKKILSAEDKLYHLPKRLQMHESQSAKRSEEMLSNQMLSGIPEVDLGIDTKIKNIERTEDAKIDLIKEMKRKKEKPSQFVPSNMAVNYVQHKRYLPSGSAHQTSNPKAKQLQVKKQSELVVGDNGTETSTKEKFNEKSSDDYHYDKFRNNSRKR